MSASLLTTTSLLGLDLEVARGGAGEAVGAIHILHRCCWVDERSRRNRAHEIGNCGRTDRSAIFLVAVGIAPAAPAITRAEEVESGDEAVVAEVGVLRLHRGLQPVESLDVTGVDESRVLDLETGGQPVDDEDAAATFGRFRP